MKFEKFGIIVYILTFILGCGVSNYDRGVSFLGQEEFDTAIPYFEAAIDSGVNTADAHRELGITYYKKEMAQQMAAIVVDNYRTHLALQVGAYRLPMISVTFFVTLLSSSFPGRL